MVMMAHGVNAMDTKNNIMDMRKAWKEFPHNKQDEHGNTFWHNLARESEKLEDWSQVNEKIGQFMNDNKRWLPNPLLTNIEGKTARQEAKESYNRSGNAVAARLINHLKNLETNFVNETSLQYNRNLMSCLQLFEHPNK